MSEEEKELISSFEITVQGLNQYYNYDRIKDCIDCKDCTSKCDTIKDWEKIKNLIEKQDKLIDLIVQDVSSDVCNSKKCSQYENCKECKLDKYRKRVEENE